MGVSGKVEHSRSNCTALISVSTSRESRDPRFDSLAGKLVPERFRKQYAFLYDEQLPAERDQLRATLQVLVPIHACQSTPKPLLLVSNRAVVPAAEDEGGGAEARAAGGADARAATHTRGGVEAAARGVGGRAEGAVRIAGMAGPRSRADPVTACNRGRRRRR